MSNHEETMVMEPLSLAQRRDFLRLPLAERRRALEQQAELLTEQDNSEAAQAERDEWQGGDLVEY